MGRTRDFFIIIFFFIIMMAVPLMLRAETVNLRNRGMHAGACAYYVSPDSIYSFRFCSEDNAIPGKPPKKYFQIVTIGMSSVGIDDNKLWFENLESKRKLSLAFENSKKELLRPPWVRTIYSVEAPQIYVNLISQRIPMAIEVKLDGVAYKFVLNEAALAEMKMIADLQ